MSSDNQVLTDTSDMFAIHDALRRAFGDAPAQVTSVPDGDAARARRLADYLDEVLWLLHAHHAGEDELLYPLLVERLPEHRELFARMEAQHVAALSSLETAQRATARFGASASETDGQAAANAYRALLAVTDEHLVEEEEKVLPIAARSITPDEWGALPGHALSHYPGQRMWLPLGLVLEAMPDDMRQNLVAHFPPPVAGMWTGGGADAFAQEMAVVRGEGPW
jgi:hemerythrin-like domain-containing protein